MKRIILASLAFLLLVGIFAGFRIQQQVYAAGSTPTIIVRPNGATVSGYSINNGSTDCTPHPVDPSDCLVQGNFVDNAETLKVIVTPPSGKKLSTWGYSGCDNSKTTCAISFTRVDGSPVPFSVYFNLSFTASTSSPDPVKKSTPVQTQTTSKPESEPESEKPQLDTKKPVSEASVNGTVIKSDEKPEFESGKTVKISGKTLPNATVYLYIFSTPREAVVRADEDGLWSYDIEDLESGDHRVELVVEDESKEQKSDRIELVSFTIQEPITIESAPSPVEDSTGLGTVGTIAVGSGVTALLAVVTLFILRRRRSGRLVVRRQPELGEATNLSLDSSDDFQGINNDTEPKDDNQT